jgi:hypothetical protein
MALAAGGDLPRNKGLRLERHLASCKPCREEYAAYRESLDLAKSDAHRERTPDWKEAEWRRVMKAVLAQETEDRRAATPLGRSWAWAAAGVVLVALVAGGFLILRKSPQPPVIARLSPSGDVVLPEQTPPPPAARPQAGAPSLQAEKTAATASDLTARPAAPSTAQPVMAMTFVSQETGLTIHWVFNDSFDYKEDKK